MLLILLAKFSRGSKKLLSESMVEGLKGTDPAALSLQPCPTSSVNASKREINSAEELPTLFI